MLLEDGTRRFVWGLGLAYEVEAGAALVYHVDGLGSVRAITNSSAAVVQTYESDEFGIPITAQGGSAQPFGFTGEQRDSENGLAYLRARYYDPQIGRFVQRDSWPGDRATAQSLSRYIYVQNNPVNLTDPSGHCPSIACGDNDYEVDSLFELPEFCIPVLVISPVTRWPTLTCLSEAGKGREQGANEWSREADRLFGNNQEAKCAWLRAQREEARGNGQTAVVKKIEQAEKYKGCRNKSKR